MNTPRRIRAIDSAPIMWWVSRTAGAWSEITSDPSITASNPTNPTPPRSGGGGGENAGSNAMTRIPRAAAARATRRPIRPMPTSPSVAPSSSSDVGVERPGSPASARLCSHGSSLVRASISAIVCSAVETVGAPGALQTTTSASAAAATSTLS